MEADFFGFVESTASEVLDPDGDGLCVLLEQAGIEGSDPFADESWMEEARVSLLGHGATEGTTIWDKENTFRVLATDF